MDYSPPGSSAHGILQATILEWVAIPFFRGSSQPRDRIRASCIAGRLFISWATRQVQEQANTEAEPGGLGRGLAGWYLHSGGQRENAEGRRGQKGRRRKRSRKIKRHRQVQLMEKERVTWEEERGLRVSLGPNLPVLEREPKYVIVKDPGKSVNALMFVFLPVNP